MEHDFRLPDGRMWSEVPEAEQEMLVEEVTDFLTRFQRLAEENIDDILSTSSHITYAAQRMGSAVIAAYEPLVDWARQMGESLAVSFASIGDAIRKQAEALESILRVPEGATVVRPLGGRSNSRKWLAWDGRSWQPCHRRHGVWYWTIEGLA